MTEFLGDANIPSKDTLAMIGASLPSVPPGGSLPGVAAGPDKWKNRATSRISVFFGAGSGKVNLISLILKTSGSSWKAGRDGATFHGVISSKKVSCKDEPKKPKLKLEAGEISVYSRLRHNLVSNKLGIVCKGL